MYERYYLIKMINIYHETYYIINITDIYHVTYTQVIDRQIVNKTENFKS